MGILSKGVHKSYEIGKTIGKYVKNSRPSRLRCLKFWAALRNVYLTLCPEAATSQLLVMRADNACCRGSFAVVKEGLQKETGMR
eukprot:3053824-Rhodomonas_salina.1